MARDLPDPKNCVEVVRADKRGDYLRVEGVAQGRKVSVDIPVPSLETFKSDSAREAYMRRSLLGTKQMEDRERKG